MQTHFSSRKQTHSSSTKQTQSSSAPPRHSQPPFPVSLLSLGSTEPAASAEIHSPANAQDPAHRGASLVLGHWPWSPAQTQALQAEGSPTLRHSNVHLLCGCSQLHCAISNTSKVLLDLWLSYAPYRLFTLPLNIQAGK